MATVIEPGYAVLSGPLARRNDCKRALEGAGFSLLSEAPLPSDPTVALPHRGLPSYRNPEEAADAGVPNAGHTPGTSHPETGEDYEGDGRIGFLDVRLPETEGALDEIVRLAQGARFTLRLHTAARIEAKRFIEPELTVDQRLAIAEAQLASIRMERLRASGVPLNAITSPPYALQQSSHSAQLFREAIGSLVRPSGGLVDVGGLAVTQNGTPNMSVNVGAGRIWVPSTYTATVNPGNGAYYPGGAYFMETDAAVNLAISAANATNPRLDQSIVQVQDAAYSGVTNSAQLAILTGTPTSGAALNNLVGLASLPASSMLLTYVLVPANATTIVTADLSANQAPLANAAGNDTGWVVITLQSGWNALAGAYTPACRLLGDRVWLRGVAQNTSGSTTFQVTLPATFKPAAQANMTGFSNGGVCQITVSAAGVATGSASTGTGAYVALDGLSYTLI